MQNKIPSCGNPALVTHNEKMCSESFGDIQQLSGQFLYPELGQKQTFFYTLPTLSCPRSN